MKVLLAQPVLLGSLLACSNGWFGLFRAGWNTLFVTGVERQVNESGPDSRIPVMAVTFGNNCPKKNLILPKTSLD
jgi:hypothetical protein